MKPYFCLNQLIESYLKSIGPLEFLSANEERELFKKYWEGDLDAFNELFFKSQYIVIEEVLYYIHSGMEVQDLIQEANYACLIALQKYEQNSSNLKNYLHNRIFRHLENFIKSNEDIVRLPLNVKAEISEMIEDLEDFYFESNEYIPISDIYERLSNDFTNINYIWSFFDSNFQIYLDKYISRLDSNLDEISMNWYERPDHHLMLESLKIDIERVLSTLSEFDADIIKLYYGLDSNAAMTLEEIGDSKNLTRERIRQIKKKTMGLLQHTSRSEPLWGYLSILFGERQHSIKEIYHLGFHFENVEHVINILTKYVEPRKRVTIYPHIKNLSQACRNIIISSLERAGELLFKEEIIDLILEVYPLININVIEYAFRTEEKVLNLGNSLYALKSWELLRDLRQEKQNRLNREVKHDQRVDLL
ncbi:MAG: sigma-70 family RNA polymerase sigma factor [Bacteroidetes bacterium]|nr:sigma-70 family RNA polymerase sigma factor [Bacteroidota bacterium]